MNGYGGGGDEGGGGDGGMRMRRRGFKRGADKEGERRRRRKQEGERSERQRREALRKKRAEANGKTDMKDGGQEGGTEGGEGKRAREEKVRAMVETYIPTLIINLRHKSDNAERKIRAIKDFRKVRIPISLFLCVGLNGTLSHSSCALFLLDG